MRPEAESCSSPYSPKEVAQNLESLRGSVHIGQSYEAPFLSLSTRVARSHVLCSVRGTCLRHSRAHKCAVLCEISACVTHALTRALFWTRYVPTSFLRSRVLCSVQGKSLCHAGAHKCAVLCREGACVARALTSACFVRGKCLCHARAHTCAVLLGVRA